MKWLVIAALWVQVSISPLEYREFTEDKFAVFTVCGDPVLYMAEVSKKIAFTTPFALSQDPVWARAWVKFVQQMHPAYKMREYKFETYHSEYIRCPESDEETEWDTEPMGRKHLPRGSQTI